MRFPLSSIATFLLIACSTAPSTDDTFVADYEPEFEPTAESLGYESMPEAAAPMGETANMGAVPSFEAAVPVSSGRPESRGSDVPANELGAASFVPLTNTPVPVSSNTTSTTNMFPTSSIAATPVTFRNDDEITASWVDAEGRRWNVAFLCDIGSDDQHDRLAAACLAASRMAATEIATEVCRQFDLDHFAGIEACEAELCRQLTALLFPCGLTPEQASVQGIRWTHWRAD
jgi:hypothetical protein